MSYARSLSGCGCGNGMGAFDNRVRRGVFFGFGADDVPPAAPTIDTTPITNVTGLPAGTTSPPFATGNLLPFVAIGGLAYFLFMRKRRRR